ncbi:hypothetical protein PVAP13_9KG243813 [Panicum virgatum]|uniref:Uncharacterized protein n=1 Tax=Panicum virgatum TaxID=38727 RepID=A0A8T0NRI4_PANVG|nr:hypothetical protein PVAP13_9KG243813 [Panicum virgatum]
MPLPSPDAAARLRLAAHASAQLGEHEGAPRGPPLGESPLPRARPNAVRPPVAARRAGAREGSSAAEALGKQRPAAWRHCSAPRHASRHSWPHLRNAAHRISTRRRRRFASPLRAATAHSAQC